MKTRALTILFVIGLIALISGMSWAQDVSFTISSATSTDYLKTYTGTGLTISSSYTVSSSSSDYFISLASTPTGAGSYYVDITSTTATIDSISIYITGNGDAKTLVPAVLGWHTTYAATTADVASTADTQTVAKKGLANAQWFSYNFSTSGVKILRLYRAVKGVTVTSPSIASSVTIGNGQTIQFYGLKVYLHPTIPTVTTTAISNIFSTTATGGGTASTYGSTVTAEGIVWSSTNATPTLSSNDGFTSETVVSTGTAFTSTLTGLTAATPYYVSAYATNSVGTSYGSVVTFTTASLTPVQLTSFTAASTGAGASLIWKTATETNNYGFSVERRTSGSNTWSDVAFVKGNGTSATAHSYSYTDASVTSGSYIYRLKQVDNDGTSSYSNEAEITVAAPSKIVSANYPNPFNPSTVIRFSVPKDGQTVVKVFNILGQEVATLFNGLATAGFQSINFNAAHMNSGVYFYSVENNGQKVVNKMLLVK